MTGFQSYKPKNDKEKFFARAFLKLKTEQEMANFLRDILTIKELEEFAKYEDEYGKASKEVLKYKDKLIVKKAEIKESIEYIQTTDNELYNLSKTLSCTLITDDIKFSRHVDGKIEGVCTGTVVSDNLVDYYNRPAPLNDIHGIGTVLLAGSEVLLLPK